MQRLYDQLKTNPVVYVTRDIERALGISLDTEGYFIISNNSDFSKQTAAGRRNIALNLDGGMKSTAELLKTSFAKNFINKLKNPYILVFKNTPQIEKICAENNWKLLNPPAKTSGQIEEKISQVKVFSSLRDLFLNYKISKCKDIQWAGEKFILQFNYSHTGSGTLLIDSAEKLEGIKTKFPEREARVSDFVDGPIFTNNNVLDGENLLMGNISYQITGLRYFADRDFSTVGNDWGWAQQMLTDSNVEYFKLIVKTAAEELKKLKWKGLFGIDVIMDKKTNKMYLIEVNARQPASATFESWLQNKTEEDGVNIFEAHLAGLLGVNLSMERLKPISNGSQIIKRITRDNELTGKLPDYVDALKKKSFEVIPYENKNIGAELLRIQSDSSFMYGHNELSKLGTDALRVIRPDILTISSTAQDVVYNYSDLKIGNSTISVPYFNNKRLKIRGGLKVFTGKGSPSEIADEANIRALKKHMDINAMSGEKIKEFLVENGIGIDCSGFAYYVLDAQLRSIKGIPLRKVIKFPHIKNLFRKILAKLRAVQNTNVLTFAEQVNSYSILPKDARPGDFIIIIDAGEKHDRNHIMVITEVETEKINTDGKDDNDFVARKITYAHSFAWSKDGKYNHGVREGVIEITDINASLIEQTWTEQEKTGDENETLERAKQAKILDIKRLNALT